MLYDVFICQASEDKDDFVRPLAELLRQENIGVWYDEFSLKIGDSLRRSIDIGLRKSRFGIVVFSNSFFEKNWTQYEMDGLVDREMSGNDKVLLPIWHNITVEDLRSYSPALAGRKAAISSDGMSAVIEQIVSVVKPDDSPLITARDILLNYGDSPPVVTDSYWLDVVEASNRLSSTGAYIADDQIWGRWSFPLPWKYGDANEWGERLAWTAMQMEWTEEAERRRISPLSLPSEVQNFIESSRGLKEACTLSPALFAEYAPQLTISGLGGQFEEIFDKAFIDNCEKAKQRAIRSPKFGSRLTTNQKPPFCDEEWMFRSASLGNREAWGAACAYFTGGLHGPTVSPYEHAEHLIWLLSDQSRWLPNKLRETLLEGMLDWGVWHWHDIPIAEDHTRQSDALFSALHDYSKSDGNFVWTEDIEEDVRARISYAVEHLRLEESVEILFNKFVEKECVSRYMLALAKHRK